MSVHKFKFKLGHSLAQLETSMQKSVNLYTLTQTPLRLGRSGKIKKLLYFGKNNFSGPSKNKLCQTLDWKKLTKWQKKLCAAKTQICKLFIWTTKCGRATLRNIVTAGIIIRTRETRNAASRGQFLLQILLQTELNNCFFQGSLLFAQFLLNCLFQEDS